MQKTQQDFWLETTLGQYLLKQEQEIFDRLVGDIFGFYAVQLGMAPLSALKNSRIACILRINGEQSDLCCESEYLPFTENSIDLICMPHTLEISNNPHQSLREAERVLMPEGHLILTGFNPFSLWGLRKALSRQQEYPWQSPFFSQMRIKDWLALLGLELVKSEIFGFMPPINNERWLARLSSMERIGSQGWPMLGGGYCIVAKKRVTNMTLLKPNWKKTTMKSGLVVSGHKRTKSTRKAHHNK